MPKLIPLKVRNNVLKSVNVERLLENVLDATAKDIKIDFDVTTQTWDNKPKFKIDKSKKFARVVSTDSDIYHFVNAGTRVRYATMTPDFSAKTRVNQIASRAGRGGLMYVDKSRPRPGIKARNFDKEIVKKWNKLIPDIFERALLSELT